MNTAFWILAWLSFSGSLFSEPHGQTTVSGELSVNRAVQVSSSAQTAATANTSVRYALWSQVLASSDADTTHLSAVYPVTSDIALSSDLSSCYLSRFSPVESSASGSSLVSGRVTVNPVNIDNLSVLGSSSVDVVLERRIGLLAEDITCSSSLVGEILPDIGIPGGEAIGRSDLIADLHLRTAIWCTSSSVSDVTGRLTVNAVDVGGDSVGASQVDADLSRRFLVDGDVIVGSTLFQVDNPDIQRTIRMSGDPVNGVALVSGTLNRFGAAFSQLYPKSQFSGTLSVRWALWSFLTTAPLSNTRLENTYLSVRWETSVSIVDPKTGIDAWAATKFKVESEIAGSSVVYAEKMTLNPVWFTGLDVFGSTQIDVDGAVNRRLPCEDIRGSSQVTADLNRFGACWTVPSAYSSSSAYLNRWGSCWSTVDTGSRTSGELSVHRSIAALMEGITSIVLDTVRKRNMEVSPRGDSDLTGHVTVNLRAITDGVSECSSFIIGDLRGYLAVEASSSGVSDVYADSYRKRNLKVDAYLSTDTFVVLNAKYAIGVDLQAGTSGAFHLSRRFYIPFEVIDGLTSLSVYLSAIRPLEGVSPSNATSVSATAYLKRNVVVDVTFGYSVVDGRVTVNGVEITDAGSLDCRSLVTGDILPYRRVEGSSSGSCATDGVLNVKRSFTVQCVGATECTGNINASYACFVVSNGFTDCSSHLSRRFYLDDSDIPCASSIQTWLGKKIASYTDPIVGSTEISARVNLEYTVSSWVADLSSSALAHVTVNPVELDAAPIQASSSVIATLASKKSVQSVISGSAEVIVGLHTKRAVFVEVLCGSQAWMDLNARRAGYIDLACDSHLSALLNKEHAIHSNVAGLSLMTSTLGVKHPVESIVSGRTDASGHLIRPRFLEAACYGLSLVTGTITPNPVYLQVGLSSWSHVDALLGAHRYFPDTILSGSSSVSVTLSSLTELRADISLYSRSFLLPSEQFLSAIRPIVVLVDQCRTDFDGHLTINAKQMVSSINGFTTVSAQLRSEDRLQVDVQGVTWSDAVLNIDRAVYDHFTCSSEVTSVLRVKRSVVSRIEPSSSCQSVLFVFIHLRGLSLDGASRVSAAIAVKGRASVFVFGGSSVFGHVSRFPGLSCRCLGSSSVHGLLSLKGVLYDGDESGIISHSGGAYRLVLVSEDSYASLPDWLRTSRSQVDVLSGLLESFRLALSERAVFDLTPLAMDPRHFLSVWTARLDSKPSFVAHPSYGLRILEASSWFELMHCPMPRWMWLNGRLYVSRLSMGMEQLILEQGRFRVASAVLALSHHPVYMLWTLPECDIAYLVPSASLQWSSDRLVGIRPRFGYLLSMRDDLQIGASYGQFSVSAKANVWLTFQSYSGGDSVPECAPLQVNLVRSGFVSVIVHSDTVSMNAARGVSVVHPSEGSLSSCRGKRGDLVGVFVGNSPPSGVEPSRDRSAPSLGQVFVIESGFRYMVPQGATRFMIGILHDGAYRYGYGYKRVTVHQYEPAGALSVIYTDRYRLFADAEVLVDGKLLTLKASSVESRFTMWMRLLGHPMSFRGWNGYDYMNYLRGVGLRRPVLPGIPPLWYRWDGQSPMVITGSDIRPGIRYTVDVIGVPSSVIWEGVAQSVRLPYYSTGKVFVDGRPGLPSPGSRVQMRVPMWSSSQQGSTITLTPSPNMKMISGNHLVGVAPYDIVHLPFRVSVGGENPVFVWSGEVS